MSTHEQPAGEPADKLAPLMHPINRVATRYATELIVVVIFLAFLGMHLPRRAQFLINWDSVNYALGIRQFALEQHQPHPPGYIGYIALGWVARRLVGDSNAGFTLLSAVSGAAAPAALFLLASRLMPQRYAAVTAVTFGLSPVVWYYSKVALGYSPEVALALLALSAAYQARREVSFRHLLVATLLLVTLGAVRQSGALFLIPVWLYVIYAFPWRERGLALGLLAAGNLAWLIPLIWLAGGPIAYFRASSGLAGLAVAPTSIFGFNPLGLLQNVGFVLGGILIGANIGLLIIAIAHRSRSRPLSHLTARDRRFLGLWLAPPLLMFVLIHTGQLGYVLLILPAAYLWVGLSLRALVQRGAPSWLSPRARGKGDPSRRSAVVTAVLVAALVVVNVAGSVYLPKQASRLAQPERATGVVQLVNDLFDSLPLFSVVSSEDAEGVAQRVRQYDVEGNDRYWDQLIHLLEEYDPSTTALLAVPDGAGSFRHLTYYLPEYRVYALGKDLDENFGHLFTAQDGTSDYDVGGLEKASAQLDLPDGITRLVVPDQGIINRFPDATKGTLIKLVGGAQVFVVPVEDGATLRFVQQGPDDARIIVAQPSESR